MDNFKIGDMVYLTDYSYQNTFHYPIDRGKSEVVNIGGMFPIYSMGEMVKDILSIQIKLNGKTAWVYEKCLSKQMPDYDDWNSKSYIIFDEIED